MAWVGFFLGLAVGNIVEWIKERNNERDVRDSNLP